MSYLGFFDTDPLNVHYVLVGDMVLIDPFYQNDIDVVFTLPHTVSAELPNALATAYVNHPTKHIYVLLAPGTYNMHTGPEFFMNIRGKTWFKGLGSAATDVVLTNPAGTDGIRNQFNFTQNSEGVVENLTINPSSQTGGTNQVRDVQYAARVLFNKVRLMGASGGGTHLIMEEGPDTPNSIVHRYCTITPPGTFFNTAVGVSVQYPRWSLDKSYFTKDAPSSAPSWHLYDISTSATQGYGHEFGDLLAPIIFGLTEITSRVIDVVSGRPVRVVVFDWTNPVFFTTPSPDVDGRWFAMLNPGQVYGIYYLSQDARNPPIIHGPYTKD